MTELEPIDRTHAEALVARDSIRRRVQQLKDQAAVWQPGPMEEEWSGEYMDRDGFAMWRTG